MARILDLTKRIDPRGCGCTDCIVGDSIPADEFDPQPDDVVIVGYTRLMDLGAVIVNRIGSYRMSSDSQYTLPVMMRYGDLHPHIITTLKDRQ